MAVPTTSGDILRLQQQAASLKIDMIRSQYMSQAEQMQRINEMAIEAERLGARDLAYELKRDMKPLGQMPPEAMAGYANPQTRQGPDRRLLLCLL